MLLKFSNVIFILLLGVFSTGIIFAQSVDPKDYPESLRENLAKRRIKEEEKEYDELVKRGEEAVKLSEEISESYEKHNKLSEEDQKKIEKLEKVVKRIRRDLGAEDDDKEQTENKPSSLSNTLNTIKEKTSGLLAELKKASRHSISVIAVESSNTVFKLVRFLKFKKN